MDEAAFEEKALAGKKRSKTSGKGVSLKYDDADENEYEYEEETTTKK